MASAAASCLENMAFKSAATDEQIWRAVSWSVLYIFSTLLLHLYTLLFQLDVSNLCLKIQNTAIVF